MKLWSALRSLGGRVGPWSLRPRPARALTHLVAAEKALLCRMLEAGPGPLECATVPTAAMGLELAEVIAIHREPAGGPYVLGLTAWAREQLRRHPALLG